MTEQISPEEALALADDLQAWWALRGSEKSQLLAKASAEALRQYVQRATEAEKRLEAMRDPTNDMIDAAMDAADGHFAIDGDKGPWLRTDGYIAAVRAMLSELTVEDNDG